MAATEGRPVIDLQLLRDDVETVAAGLARRGWDRARVDELVALDDVWRGLVGATDDARAEQKAASKTIGSASNDERPAMIARASELKQATADLEAQTAAAEQARNVMLLTAPNLPEDDAPDGEEGDGPVLRTFGTKPTFSFPPKDHVEILEAADALDLGRAARVSGARFAYLKGEAVLLEFALVRYALDIAMEHGFTPMMVPILVRRDAMVGTGFLPGDEQQLFKTDDRDDLYMIGTSEVPLASYHAGEILEPHELPLRYAGYSPCLRREAGSAGKDTRGILRVHQFEKVELFSFCPPASSKDEHERMLTIEEQVFSGLGIHAQVVDVPIGDLGNPAARKFDIEAWMPGQDAYREVTSTSNTTDYQARRLNIRIRNDDGKNTTAHTCNGTAIAIQRAIIALVETHQRKDGTVLVPDALQHHLGREVLFAS
jgi:seryl-tRNA synthetase